MIIDVNHPETNSTGPCFRTVLLDRDGVINEKMAEGEYVCCVADFRLLPGVSRAIARLNQAGVLVLVVSNQRGVALGLYSSETVNAIHHKLQQVLGADGAHVDAFFFCPHDKNSCECRKPLPGLYRQAAARFPDIRPETSVMIGDSPSDIEFGKSLRMRTIWIEGPAETRKNGWESAARMADMQFASLPEAVDALLRK
jgi:D-glycero-D-manno-heptose 1,7-bisphosphate phosphatase